MFKDVLTHMEHATWYANVGLLIFVAVFILVSIRAALASRRDVARHATLPLDDEPSFSSRNGEQR